ncbi:MAG TPA: hypothetical protein DEG43_08015 [Acidimicrobiaceae bacterium]|jgi:cytochrome b6-f complex iron-sulfur subunit|nr:hypothetical protein [Acidimicrobiaceae bacterium]
MGPVIVIAIVLIVLAAAGVVVAGSRRKELGSATGELSRETLKRDSAQRKAKSETSTNEPALVGKSLERAAIVSRGALVPAGATAPVMWVPPDAEELGVTRRMFLNRSIVSFMGLSILTFAASAFTAFLWPTGAGGFGSKIRVGKIVDLKSEIKKNGGFLYKPEGRMWLVEYPETALPKARVAYAGLPCLPAMEAGVMPIYQKCVHLGCRVPSCLTSQWFECPCHGSQYNQAGERKGGPAPRGLDSFATEVSPDGVLTVDTGKIVQGSPLGTNTTGQEAQGPHCL